MVQPLRVEYPKAYYRLMNRGSPRRNISLENKWGLRQAPGLLDPENDRNNGDAVVTHIPGTSDKIRIDKTTTPNSSDRLESPTSVAVKNIAVS